MQEISYMGIWGWFLAGLSAGMGPCSTHQFLIVLPYIGLKKKGTFESFLAIMYFSLARIITLTVLGLIAGMTGGFFYQRIMTTGFTNILQALLGVFLLAFSLIILLFDKTYFCKKMNKILEIIPGDVLLITGFITPLIPCPIILGLLLYAAGSGSYLYGGLSGFLFGAGTAISPLLLAGPLMGFMKNRVPEKIKKIIINTGGILLFGYGLHLLLSII